MMPRIIHPVAGLIALLTIATFWISTASTELFASDAAVAAVKTAIPCGFILLIPALAITGGSGFALAKGARKGLVGVRNQQPPGAAAARAIAGGAPPAALPAWRPPLPHPEESAEWRPAAPARV